VRILLCAILVGLCAWAGRSAAMVQVRRARLLKTVLGEMEPLRLRMLSQRLPLKDALSGCVWEEMREMGKEMEQADAVSAWKNVCRKRVSRGEAMDCLEEEELKVLDGFFAGLGESGVRQQEALFENTKTELERILQAASKTCGEKTRLYTALGALAGAALVIMVF